MRRVFLIAVALLGVSGAGAQDATSPDVKKSLDGFWAQPGEIEEPMYDVSFVIVGTVSEYRAARRLAKNASRRLHIRLDLRGLRPTKTNGLTHSKASCAADDDTYPCYRPRGRWDDGEYVSIEVGENGSFDVVVASGREGVDPGFKPDILERARTVFPESRVEKRQVWFGCAH